LTGKKKGKIGLAGTRNLEFYRGTDVPFGSILLAARW